MNKRKYDANRDPAEARQNFGYVPKSKPARRIYQVMPPDVQDLAVRDFFDSITQEPLRSGELPARATQAVLKKRLRKTLPPQD